MGARVVATNSLLADKYRLLHEIGRGGMGVVWRAEHLTLGSPVAVKVLHPWVLHSPDARARFFREARAAAALRSPHVVQILDSGVHGDIPFIVMELLEGEPLSTRLAREGRLSEADVARIATHVSRALSRAHDAGVVHRDLKPENVFLVRNADEEIAKVLDFGIAKAGAEPGGGHAGTQTGAVLGTPCYMSPEQARGNRDVDHRSDLWSLGVIVFECLTGRRPFDSPVLGDLLMKICSDPIPVPSQVAIVPTGFDQWFARATERDRTLRFQCAEELAGALRAVLAVEPQRPGIWSGAPAGVPVPGGAMAPASAVTTTEPAPPRRRALPWVVAGAVGMLFVAAACGVALLVALRSYSFSPGSPPGAATSVAPPAPEAPVASASAPAPSASVARAPAPQPRAHRVRPRKASVHPVAAGTSKPAPADGTTGLATGLDEARKAQTNAEKMRQDVLGSLPK